MSVSIFPSRFFTKTSRNGCSVLLNCSLKLISLCKLFKILCNVSKSLTDFVHGMEQSSRNRFQLVMKYFPNSFPKTSVTFSYDLTSRCPILRVA